MTLKTLNLQDMAERISSGGSGLKLNITLMVLESFMEELEKAAIEGNEFRHEVLSMQHVIKPGICIREPITQLNSFKSVASLSFTHSP